MMREPEHFYALRISVFTFNHISYTDISPALDAFNEHFASVEAGRWNSEPPMAGGPDVAILVSIAAGFAGGAVLQGFFSELGKDLYITVRTRLLSLFSKAEKSPSGRLYLPLAITIGRARFYFEQEITDEEFKRRLAKAAEYIRQLPAAALEGDPGPGEYGLRWDQTKDQWVGTLMLDDLN